MGFMAEQAKAQQQHYDLKMGNAPHVPATGRARTKPAAKPKDSTGPNDASKLQHMEAENKRLRAAAGKPPPKGPKPPPVSEEVKLLQKRLKNYRAVLVDDPDDQNAKN